jgi:hypothetical protein
MPEVYTVELIDELAFEQASHTVPPYEAVLRQMEEVILAQDDSCEYLVSLTGNCLKLWDPGLCPDEQETQTVSGTLEDAVQEAERWLIEYLEIDEEQVTRLIDPEEFIFAGETAACDGGNQISGHAPTLATVVAERQPTLAPALRPARLEP